MAMDFNTPFQGSQFFGFRHALDLDPVFPLMRLSRMEQALVQARLVAEKQQSFGVGVKPAYGINRRRKAKITQRPIRRTVWSELGEDTIGFVKCQEHAAQTQGWTCTRNMEGPPGEAGTAKLVVADEA